MNSSHLQRVLVPVAFSSPDDRPQGVAGELVEVEGASVWIDAANLAALDLAARMVEGGCVRLLHATPELTHVGVVGGLGAPWFPIDADGRLTRLARARATAVLQHLARRCGPRPSVEIAVSAARPWKLILADARDAHVDAIVLAVSGHGPLRRAALGSTADKVIRRAPCPVIVVPGPDEGPADAPSR